MWIHRMIAADPAGELLSISCTDSLELWVLVGVCYARPTDEMIIVFQTPTEAAHVMGPLVKS